MKTFWRFAKVLALFVLLFGVFTIGTTVLLGSYLDRILTEQYESKGQAIATGIAMSSAEVLLFRDAATIQAMIDQYLEEGKIQGIAYIFVVDERGKIISHTFAPSIPAEAYTLRGSRSETKIQQVRIEDRGDFIDIATPILNGEIGHVHVGMDRSLIQGAIRHALVQQIVLMGIVFLLSVLAAYWLLQADQAPQRPHSQATVQPLKR